MPKLEISLLGPMQVIREGQPITDFGADSARALLAYLALESDRPVRREMVAGLLWPEYPEPEALRNLRTALYRLRGAIGDRDAHQPLIEVTRRSLQLVPDADIWVDVKAFTELLDACQEHVHPQLVECPDCIARLTEAVDLYRGDFLQGFYLDSTAFEEWQSFRTRGLKDRVFGALTSLATYYTSQGNFERAIDHARRCLTVDPLHEPAHRHLMVLYAKSDQRAAALRQYETCRHALELELGVEPSERTQEVYQQLLRDELPAAPASVEAILEQELRTVGPCPYLGLAPFREADAALFFGRESFIERLAATVTGAPFITAVVGASGSGKSSVVTAGLLPRLRETSGWLIATCRPGSQPFRTLANALIPLLEPDLSETARLIERGHLADALAGGEVTLIDVIARIRDKANGRPRVLLFIDQFEELYTLCPDPQVRRSFIDMVLSGVQSAAPTRHRQVPLTLLLTLRADFMGQALTHRRFADALQTACQMLGPMTREELRAAIVKPAEAQGAAFERGLVARLLNDVGEEPGNLPLLEFALTLLWERLDFGWLTHAAYEAIGQVQGALARYAQEEFEALTLQDRELARRIFVQLVQPGEGTEDTRRVAPRADLASPVGLGDEAWDLVQHLADRRLVVTNHEPSTGVETAEVVHEALIHHWDQLQTWMAEDRIFRTWQERLRVSLRTWLATDCDEGALLRGIPLVEAEEWLGSRAHDLGPSECEFIQAAIDLREQRAAERATQRQRELESSRQLAEAHDQTQRQAAIGLAAEARNQMRGPNQDIAVVLALEAIEHYPYTWQAERALAQVVLDHRLVMEFAHGVPITARPHLSPDGTRFLTASHDGLFRVWDLQSGENLLTASAYQGTDAPYHWAHWSPSGDRILTTSKKELPLIWDAATGELLVELAGHGGFFAEWSPDSARVLSYWSSREDAATVWDAQTGQVVHSLPGNQGMSAHYSPDGKWIATSFGEIWDAVTGEIHKTLAAYQHPTTGDTPLITWSPDGTALGSGMGDTAHVWDAATGVEILTLRTGYHGRTKLWWSPGGTRLLTLGAEELEPAIMWDATIGEELGRFPNSAVLNWGLYPWSEAGDRILLPDTQGRITVWEAASGRQLLELVAHAGYSEANWLPDDSGFITTGRDGKARIWRISTAKLDVGCRPDCPARSMDSYGRSPVWSPAGDQVARSYSDGTIRIWHVASGAETLRFQKVSDVFCGVTVYFMAWSPDGGRILTGASDGDVDIWDSATGRRLLALPGHDGIVCGVHWSPDGRRVLTCGRDRRAVVWDAVTGEALTVFTGQDFYWGAWSPDGSRIVLVDMYSYGGPVKIWDVATGEALMALLPDDFPHGTSAVAWSPDGTRIVTFSLDQVGRMWDAETEEQLGSFTAPGEPMVAEWSPSGNRFLVGGASGVHVWDATALQEVISYPAEGEEAIASWSPGGKALAISYPNGDLRVFPAGQSLKELVAYAKEHCVLRELTPEERAKFGLPER